jgi:hypothetical protein
MSTLNHKPRATYRSYLLRVWSASGRDQDWRATIERIGQGDRLCFASLDELAAFLQDEARSEPGPSDDGDPLP